MDNPAAGRPTGESVSDPTSPQAEGDLEAEGHGSAVEAGPGVGETAEKSTEKSATKAADKPADKSADKPADKSADKSAAKATDKPAEKSAEKSVEKSVQKTAEESVEKPVEKSTETDTQDEKADEEPIAGNDTPANPPKRTKTPGRDPLWARLLILAGVLLMLGASGAITATKVLAARYDSTVRKGNLIAPGARTGGGGDESHSRVTGPLNYLLIGSDARTDDPSGGARSDTIIIVHIPVTMDRAYLISIPRVLRVQIPPFPATGFLGAHEKINGAFEYGGTGEGGVQLLSTTLSQLMGITFDGAAVVDFSGFQKAIGLLGGVYMCIDERTESHHIGHDKNGNFLAPWYGPDGEYRNYESTPVVYEQGCRHLNQWEALDYSRQRKSIPDGDYGRQRHQQQLLKAMFDEARRQGVATNPRKLDGLIRSVGQSLTVDTGGVALADLVYALRDVKPADLVGVKVPSEPQDIGGISYVLALDDQASALYDAVRTDNLDNWVLANPDWVNGL
jgi:LCP family protein required for cell wall assembly